MSDRDQQVGKLLMQGYNNVEIAKQLNIALRTVKAHVTRLFILFGVTTGVKRVKLAVVLYRRQLSLKSNAVEHKHPVRGRTLGRTPSLHPPRPPGV
jgi:DNA-binding CsgD family transcriptional regulator